MLPETLPAEAQDLFNYLGRRVANQQVNCVIRLLGRADESRLAAAVDLILRTQPVLGYALVEEAERPFWQRLSDDDWGELCPVVENTADDGSLWRFVTEAMVPFAGPRLRLRLLRGVSSDTVCVKMDHVAADAAGTRQCALLLAEIYGRLARDADYRPAPNLHAERGQGQVLKHIVPDVLADIAQRFRGGGAPAFGWPSIGTDLSSHRIAFRRLPPEGTGALRALGRSQNATLNDVLLAAFYRTLIASFDPPAGVPLPVQVPIDLRRYLHGGAEAICNLSGGLFPTLIRQPGATFRQTLADVSTVMKSLKADHPGIGSALFMESIARRPFGQTVAALSGMLDQSAATQRSHPYLSNLGIIEWPHLRDDPSAPQLFGDVEIADAFLVGPVLYPPASMLAVSTFSDTLTFTMGYPDRAVDATMVEGFLDTFLHELPV